MPDVKEIINRIEIYSKIIRRDSSSFSYQGMLIAKWLQEWRVHFPTSTVLIDFCESRGVNRQIYIIYPPETNQNCVKLLSALRISRDILMHPDLSGIFDNLRSVRHWFDKIMRYCVYGTLILGLSPFKFCLVESTMGEP